MRLANVRSGLLTILALLLLVPAANAAQDCVPLRGGGQRCIAGIKTHKLKHVAALQKRSQWCWAASISMVFGYHEHPLAQEQIVGRTYGGIVNMPAMNGRTITWALSRPWVDARGRSFQASVRVWDRQAGQLGMSTADVIAELRADRPLIVGTRGHAMVVTAIEYDVSPWRGVSVVSVMVRDPWPGRGSRRLLSFAEMNPTYVAAIRIQERRLPAPRRPRMF